MTDQHAVMRHRASISCNIAVRISDLTTLRHHNRHFRNSSLLPLLAITRRLLDVMQLLTVYVQRRQYFGKKKHYVIATDSVLVCAIFNRCFPGVRGFCPIPLFKMPFSYCCHIFFVLSAYCLDFVCFYSFCFVFAITCLLYIWHLCCYAVMLLCCYAVMLAL